MREKQNYDENPATLTEHVRDRLFRARMLINSPARETGQTVERIEKDTHRNFWMDAEAALAYGLVGQIVEHADEVK